MASPYKASNRKGTVNSLGLPEEPLSSQAIIYIQHQAVAADAIMVTLKPYWYQFRTLKKPVSCTYDLLPI
jgi:hypothetical protein